MVVTKVGFGGIPLQRLSDEDAVRTIRRGLDQGINWVDTAHGYGTSEERFGKAIKKYERNRIRVFTKGPGQDPEAIREQMACSFERLDVEVIDLYQFHNVKSPEALKAMQENGTIDAVLEMKQKGRILHVGASAHTLDAALAALDHPEIEVIQFPFNFIMIDDSYKVLERCRQRKAGFIAMKPFGGGILGDAEVCVRFQLQYPDVVLDPGFEKMEEVDQVVALCNEWAASGKPDLTEENRRTIERLREELGTSFCRRCGYCMPCPNGVLIPNIMSTQSFIKRMPTERLFSGFVLNNIASYDNCIDCGECEEKCPYKLSIRETMKFWVEKHRELQREYEKQAAG
jgi:predicted aldo/keto reductase-like oxidoreductase